MADAPICAIWPAALAACENPPPLFAEGCGGVPPEGVAAPVAAFPAAPAAEPAAPATVVTPPVNTPAAISAEVTPALTAGARKDTKSLCVRFGEPPNICDTCELANQTIPAYRTAPHITTQQLSTLAEESGPACALIIQEVVSGQAAPASMYKTISFTPLATE